MTNTKQHQHDDYYAFVWTYLHYYVLPITTHIILLLIYLIPIYSTPPALEPVFDEFQIFRDRNQDVWSEDVSVIELFQHDYWGTPLQDFNSNRSWRPMSVLSFRFVRFFTGVNSMGEMVYLNRLVNVILHACTAEMVGMLSCRMFVKLGHEKNLASLTILRALSKLMFGLHPTHVEVAANGANRAHVLGMLCSLIALDERLPIIFSYLVYAVGLLSCETCIFLLPAILITLVTCRWITTEQTSDSLKESLRNLIPRLLALSNLAFIYIFIRLVFGLLSINELLFKDIISPFFKFQGFRRISNYAMVTAIHILKGLFVDPVGQAHEYAYDCIPEVQGLSDWRILLFPTVIILFTITAFYAFRTNLYYFMYYLTFCAWFLTLFPITGIITTGTFIADRLVYPSTVASCIFGARAIVYVLFELPKKQYLKKSFAIMFMIVFLLKKSEQVFYLTKSWTTRPGMLRMTLNTCPNNAKAILEMGMIQLQPESLPKGVEQNPALAM